MMEAEGGMIMLEAEGGRDDNVGGWGMEAHGGLEAK